MSKHAQQAKQFLRNKKQAAWHDETLWLVREKRDRMAHQVPEWEQLREAAHQLKQYSNSHLDTLLTQFEANATRNGAIVHWAKDAAEYCQIVEQILRDHNFKHSVSYTHQTQRPIRHV